MTPDTPVALDALGITPRGHSSTYPPSIQAFLGERLAGREKRALSDAFGLTYFGVNLTRLAPDAVSALRHAHSRQDELIYILAGSPTCSPPAEDHALLTIEFGCIGILTLKSDTVELSH